MAFDVEEYKAFIAGLNNVVDTWEIASDEAPGGAIQYTLTDQFTHSIPSSLPDSMRRGQEYLYRVYSGIEYSSAYSFDAFIEALQIGYSPQESNLQGQTISVDHGYGPTRGLGAGNAENGKFQTAAGSGLDPEAAKDAEYDQVTGRYALRNEFLAYFKEAMGINDSDYQALWDGLRNNVTIMNDSALVTTLKLDGDFEDFVRDNLERSFTHFLNNYDWQLPSSFIGPTGEPLKGPGYDYVALFLGDLKTYYSMQAKINDGALYGGTGAWAATGDLISYKTLYFENVPGATQEDFEHALSDFYKDVIVRDHYFLPSHHLRDWTQKVEQDRLVATGFVSKLAGNSSGRTVILLKIFVLLVQVIETLQDVARAQAERLKFYAAFQKAYTDRIGMIPMMNPEISRSQMNRGWDQGDNKNDLQYHNVVLGHAHQLAQAMQDTMRARRSVIGDESKQHQTTVNQSNEMVTQQANLATTILQQMSTIITSMFK